MGNCIRKVAKEVLGESKGKRHDNKETSWWSVEVQGNCSGGDVVTKFGRALGI